jgi:hypothetical protein
MTIATSLNIDGRQLASMLSEHIISMMSNPDSAPAADWQSMPHGPDSQFSAAWRLAVRTALGRRRRERRYMAGLLAVGIAILLAVVLCAGYALVLRELRQINANLERLIEFMDGTRRHDEPLRQPPRDIGWNPRDSYKR